MSTPSIEQVGARIRRLRQRRDMTQVELSEVIGVTQATVSSWEHGAKLDHVRLAEIATALGVTLGELLAPVDDDDEEDDPSMAVAGS